MIEGMATVRITEAELARDVRAVLEKIERGSEVIDRSLPICTVALISL